MTFYRIFLALMSFTAWTSVAQAQSGQAPAADQSGRTIKAIGYIVGGGDTTVDLKPTDLMRDARGEAKVQANKAVTDVQIKVERLTLPTQLGSEFLTFVVWAVSPEGRAANLGELQINKDGKGQLLATTQLQSFSLFVTAEPYSAVRQPSEMLVLENDIRKSTKGRLFVVTDYKLMRRSQYQKLGNPLALTVDLKNTPLEVYQARNAVDIAQSRNAQKYAPEVFSKAQGGLLLMEDAIARKANKKDIVSLARQTAQSSEDARALSVERQDQERVANEKAAAAAKARADAEAVAAANAAEAKRRADLEAAQQAQLAAAREAQLRAENALRESAAREAAARASADAAAREAELKAANALRESAAREAAARAEAEAAARETRLKAEADAAAAKAKADADDLAAREAAAKNEATRARKAADDLRAQLLEQFNRILETRDSVRGLVVTMADVTFDTGKADLRPTAREALARLSGIVLGHPGLNLDVEGHTDNTGSDELNQQLSEQRAGTVRSYLVQQGVPAPAVSATGFGKNSPTADNSTAAGRQKNRRVELIVSGEVIGVAIGR